MKSGLMLCYLSSSTALLLLCMKPCLALQKQPRPRNWCLIFYATKAQFDHVFLSWTSKINNQRIVCPLILPQARHAKNGVEAEGQQDELGDGLNLVNCGIYLDVNNVMYLNL